MFIKTHHFNDNELNLRDLTVELNSYCRVLGNVERV